VGIDPEAPVTVAVKVRANARKNTVEVLPDGSLKVCVAVPALEGKANAKVCDLLAAHYGVAKRQVQIKRGVHASRKLVEIIIP
jgi:uncharacterized protein YggU (UPF0235/DUF167 family)